MSDDKPFQCTAPGCGQVIKNAVSDISQYSPEAKDVQKKIFNILYLIPFLKKSDLEIYKWRSLGCP